MHALCVLLRLTTSLVLALLLHDLVVVHVLVGEVRLELDEIVEEGGPRLRVVVRREVAAPTHGLLEVEEHVPRVPRYPPDLTRMGAEKVDPPGEQFVRVAFRSAVGLIGAEDELPKAHRHLDRQDLLARLQAEAEGEAVEVLELERVFQDLGHNLGEAGGEPLEAVRLEGAEAGDELGAGEPAHRLQVALPREHQDAELVRPEVEVAAQRLDPLREDGVLPAVLVLGEQVLDLGLGAVVIVHFDVFAVVVGGRGGGVVGGAAEDGRGDEVDEGPPRRRDVAVGLDVAGGGAPQDGDGGAAGGQVDRGRHRVGGGSQAVLLGQGEMEVVGRRPRGRRARRARQRGISRSREA